MASSNAMKTVPEPTPLRFTGAKSAIHAKIVGLEIPVEIPKTIAPTVYWIHSLEKPRIIILSAMKNSPIASAFLLPIRSERLLAKRRMTMVLLI